HPKVAAVATPAVATASVVPATTVPPAFSGNLGGSGHGHHHHHHHGRGHHHHSHHDHYRGGHHHSRHHHRHHHRHHRHASSRHHRRHSCSQEAPPTTNATALLMDQLSNIVHDSAAVAAAACGNLFPNIVANLDDKD